MKRSQPKRSTKRIPRYAELPKSTRPIRARKVDPKARRWASHRCDPFREWLKAGECCITGTRTGEHCAIGVRWGEHGPREHWIAVVVDPAHTRPRSLGADDLYECLPLARHLHEEQEAIGWTRFEKRYGIDRKALATEYADSWLATPDGLAWLAEHPETA